MSQKNCEACADLQNSSPNFIVNGMTATEVASLQNNTGLNPSSGNNDCTDLNNMNDCLIGNMAEEIEAYDVCDWKPFMKKLIPNLWSTLKGIIAAVCGLWARIGSYDSQIAKIWCWLNHMNTNTGGVLHAYVDDDPSKPAINGFRIAAGVQARTGANAAPLNISVIGATARVTGSLTFNGNMPSSYCGNSSTRWLDFDADHSDITNSAGNSSYKGNAPSGGLFIYEYQINPCDYGFSDLYNCNLLQGEGGRFVCRLSTYKSGDKYPYDYGWGPGQSGQTYSPSDPNKILIQVRLTNVDTWGFIKNTGNATPNGVTMAVPCKESWSC